MYCNNCGALLSDGAVFCSKCGVRVAVQGAQNQRVSVNEQAYRDQNETRELLRNLDVALPIYQKIAEYEDRIQQLKNKMTKHISFREVILIGIGILIGSLFLAVIVGLIFNKTSSDTIITLTTVIFIVALIGIAVLQKIWSDRLWQKIRGLQQDIDSFIRQNLRPELFYLPEPYQYYMAASYIRDCIVNKRARNLTEAINLYEDQLHKWQMENYQQMIYQVQVQQAAIMRYRR